MMILKFRSEDSCNELLSKIKKIRMCAEDLEECIERATEESAYSDSRRQNYDNNYDTEVESNSRMSNRYYYPRR